MSTRERILDDLARLSGGTVGAISDLKSHIKEAIRVQIDATAQNLNLVPREDLEKLEALYEALQKQYDQIELRLATLEKKQGK